MWGALILKIAEPSLVPCVTLIRVIAQPRKLLGQRFDLSRGPAFPYWRSATLVLRFGRNVGRRGGGGALDEGGLD